MKKILVLVESYPNNGGGVAMMYVHTRNKAYSSSGIDVTVLNFHTEEDYVYEGIRVISMASYLRDSRSYDLLVCHAANLRHHYRFLKKYGKEFAKFIFFFHGHEVLKVNSTYSKPYSYIHTPKYKVVLQNIYDDLKLGIWRRYYTKVVGKARFVFVSQWMLDEFLKWTKIPYEKIKGQSTITYNCIGKPFEDSEYDVASEKKYDFITIRGNLDGSKYCIDIVNELAKNNPKMRFLVVGKGMFFNHYEKADNIEWKNQTMNHEVIIHHLQVSRCALMPTRTDAQGLMMCEMASIGIPLITSDIPVCHEVFDAFDNVSFISNEVQEIDLEKVFTDILRGLPYKKNDKYYNDKTSMKEIELIQEMLE